MRAFTIAAGVLLVATSAKAQGIVGGYAFDKTTGTPLACVDVSMVRDDSTVVARTRTMEGGAFVFQAPAAGRYQLRFLGYGVHPVSTEFEVLSPTTEQDRIYRLDQAIAIGGADFRGYKETDANAPPRPRDPGAAPRYPERLRRESLEGTAIVRYLVDSVGRVDAKHIERLMDSDMELFAAVQSFLVRTEFFPGRRAFTPVCDLVVQAFVFQMRRE